MTVVHSQPESTCSDDAFTPSATPEDTVTNDSESRHTGMLSFSPVPVVGGTFILRSTSCGRFLTTTTDGEVSLTDQCNTTSERWECVETCGWLGFRNVSSQRFLGHKGWNPEFQCWFGKHNWWEMFQVRPAPDGGYILLTAHYNSVRPVALKGTKNLMKGDPSKTRGVVWQFIEVDPKSECTSIT